MWSKLNIMEQLKKAALGTQGLEVPQIGLGCMGMTFAYGGQDDTESRATLERALELGVTFFDTADSYGFGRSESLLGIVLSRKRGELVIGGP